MMADVVMDRDDRRLIAALQCDGRLTVERLASVLGLPVRGVSGRLRRLPVRILAARPRPPLNGAMLLRVRVLRGKLDAVATALAARDDVPLVEVSAGGDQVIAVHLPSSGSLLFRQLPATTAVTSVDAQTVLHVFSDGSDWILDALTTAERAALTRPETAVPAANPPSPRDPLDQRIVAVLEGDGRASASAIAQRAGAPESTVRRRLTGLLESGQARVRAVIDPAKLGLTVDADLRLQLPPARLDEVGRTLATHPAVHGVMALTGPANLFVAVWLPTLEHLYRFLTHDLAALDIPAADTLLIGHTVKRPPGW